MRRALALFVVLTGCNPFGPSDFSGLTLDLRVNPHTARPGTNVEVTAIAYLPAEQRLSKFRVRLNGFGGQDSVDLPIVGPGPHGYTVALRLARLPIEGEVHVDLIAQLGAEYDSVRRTLTVADDGPPQVSIEAVSAVEPPDSLYVQYLALDSSAVDSLVLRVRGAATHDLVVQGDTVVAVGGLLRLWVPPQITLGDSITIDAEVTDIFGKRTSGRHVVRVSDITFPVVTMEVDRVLHPELSPTPSTNFFPGDTMRVRIVASDSRGIRRLGYTWLGQGDSVSTAGTTDSATFMYVVPPGTNEAGESIIGFAVDSFGNRGGELVGASVMDGQFRPIVLIDYAGAQLQTDEHGGVVLDPARDRLYFTTLGNRVEVVGLNPLAPLPGMEFGTPVRAIDLTPSGDSLVVLITAPNRLVIWRLTGTPAPIDTLAINTMPLRCEAWDMKVAANGRALITGVLGCPTVDMHLRTGAQRLRRLDNQVRNLDRSGDHRVIAQWEAFTGAVYLSDTDSIEPIKTLFPQMLIDHTNTGPALDHTGRRILMRNRLFDSTLSYPAWLLPDPGQLPPPRALSADGGTAFVGMWPGYWNVAVPSGALRERVILPLGGGRFLAHPDGERLIIFGSGRISVVDLR